MPKSERLFVYGTLKFSRFQKVAFGRSAKGRIALLENYLRSKADFGGKKYFVICHQTGSNVKGLLLEVSRRELALADSYEGWWYVRKKVRLSDGTLAWAYIYTQKNQYLRFVSVRVQFARMEVHMSNSFSENLQHRRSTPEVGEKGEKMPEVLDTKTTLFAYGYLLEVENLRSLLAMRREQPKIEETSDVNEAQRLAGSNPNAVVLLRDVILNGVEVSVITERQMREERKKWGLAEQPLIDEGLMTEEPRDQVYLHVKPVGKGERGSFVRGGLIIGLTDEELTLLDRYEPHPVYTRQHVSNLTIREKKYTPENITYYEGTPMERTDNDRLEAFALARKDKGGDEKYGPHAKFPHNVRDK